MLVKAFSEDSFDISKVKYILKVSGKNDKILKMVLENLNKHPELVDEFCHFLINYVDNPKVGEKIYRIALRNTSPYEYVQGKYWYLLSCLNFDTNTKNNYIDTAINRLRKNKRAYPLKLGLYKFLCSTNNKLVLNWLKHEDSSLIQSFVIPNIPKKCIDSEEYLDLINSFAQRSNYEPLLAAIKELLLHFKVDTLKWLKERLIDLNDPSGVVKNTLGKPENIDSIGQILSNRYKIKYTRKWVDFLCKDYLHANNVIFMADKTFHIDKNAWVNYTDTFNDIIVRTFIKKLTIKHPNVKWPSLIDSKGKNANYGNLLAENNQFSRRFPQMSDGFRKFHRRRSKTPASHAYDKKTLEKTRIVTRKEQKELFDLLKTTYTLFVVELDKLDI